MFFVLALACYDQTIHTLEDGVGGDGPQIDVTPEFLDFGELGANAEPVTKTFTITSIGTLPAAIEAIHFDGEGYNSFHLAEPFDGPVPLAVGDSLDIDVVFEPWGNDEWARALVQSDDPDIAQWPVELMGSAIVPELDVDPDPLDHGQIGIGCERENTATITSVGDWDVTISSIEVTGADFELLSAPALPLTLAPGETTTVDMRFSPSVEGATEGALVITSDEAMGTREALQLGEGVVDGNFVDTWDIPEGDPPSDIVFAIDSSCSMSGDAWNLVNNFEVFINELDHYTTDWQVMVAAEDDGCNTSGILTSSTPNYKEDFQNAVFFAGFFADWTEALLTINRVSIEETKGGGCNKGFLRDGALLHIIDVTDEPEQSVEMGGLTWDENVQAIWDLKGDPSMVRISAIAGPIGGSSCAAEGTGYDEAVTATGGVFLDICTNWATSANMALLAEASINQSTYLLSNTPVESSIVVKVNGNKRTDWTYDATRNVVVFDADYPKSGAHIEITYSGVGDCD
jgi:hypothetical protein